MGDFAFFFFLLFFISEAIKRGAHFLFQDREGVFVSESLFSSLRFRILDLRSLFSWVFVFATTLTAGCLLA